MIDCSRIRTEQKGTRQCRNERTRGDEEAAEKHVYELRLAAVLVSNWRRARLVAVPLVELHRAVERAGEQGAREVAEAHAGRQRRVIVRGHELIPRLRPKHAV